MHPGSDVLVTYFKNNNFFTCKHMVLGSYPDPANSTSKYSDLIRGGKCQPSRSLQDNKTDLLILLLASVKSCLCIFMFDKQEEVLLEVLGLAHKYGFLDLQTAMSEFLKKKLNIANVCLIFDMASMYSLRGLCDKCCEFMDQNAADILQSESFLTLSVVSYLRFCYLRF